MVDSGSRRHVTWAGLESGDGGRAQQAKFGKNLDGLRVSDNTVGPDCLEIQSIKKGSLVNLSKQNTLDIPEVDLVHGLENHPDDSRETERAVSRMELIGAPTGCEHDAATPQATEGSSVGYSDDDEAGVPCGSLSRVETVDPNAPSSLSLVRVDLAERFSSQLVAHDEVMVLGLNQDTVAHPEVVGLEIEYKANAVHTSVMDLLAFDAEPQSLLVCKPLAIIEPPVQKAVFSGSSGEAISNGLERYKWVNHQYRGICKLMGFPIDSHEQQCLDLLQSIKALRDSKRKAVGSRKVASSGLKGVRELKNLASSVNYEGKRRVC